MHLLKLGLAAVAALGALGACAPTGQSVTRLGPDPVLTGGTYSTGGGLTVASTLREIDGRLALCGVWSESLSQVSVTRGKAANVLASGAAYLDDDQIWTGLDFMRKVPPTTDYAGQPAACVTTARPWQSGAADRLPVIRLPRQEVYSNRDAGAGGQVITFRQTGPGALSGALDLVEELFGDTVRIPLGDAPALAGGRYSSGGGLTLAAELRRIGDEAYVCGAWAESRGQSPRTEKQAPEVLARGEVRVAGRALIRDLRFFRRGSPTRPIPGRPANCRATGQPWAGIGDAARATIHLQDQVIYWGPGRRVIFTPSGPGA